MLMVLYKRASEYLWCLSWDHAEYSCGIMWQCPDMTSMYQCYVVSNLDSVHSVWYIFRLSNSDVTAWLGLQAAAPGWLGAAQAPVSLSRVTISSLVITTVIISRGCLAMFGRSGVWISVSVELLSGVMFVVIFLKLPKLSSKDKTGESLLTTVLAKGLPALHCHTQSRFVD